MFSVGDVSSVDFPSRAARLTILRSSPYMETSATSVCCSVSGSSLRYSCSQLSLACSGHRTESILISRFLMNLQEANIRLTTGASLGSSNSTDSTVTSTLHFHQVIGSLGNSIFAFTRAADDYKIDCEDSTGSTTEKDCRDVQAEST